MNINAKNKIKKQRQGKICRDGKKSFGFKIANLQIFVAKNKIKQKVTQSPACKDETKHTRPGKTSPPATKLSPHNNPEYF